MKVRTFGRSTLGAVLAAVATLACSDTTETGSDLSRVEPSGDQSGSEAAAPSTKMTLRIENVGAAYDFLDSGAFTTAVGASKPGPIGPDGVFEFRFSAARTSRLSFATMFAQSNDLFYAPDENGIPLYDQSGNPTVGNVTAYVRLWNAGTERDEEPGLGPTQAPRQAAPNTGEIDPLRKVRPATNDFGNLPPVSDVLLATLSHEAGTFTLRIQNCSTASTLRTSDGRTQAVPLSPGVYVVHEKPSPLFQSGVPDRGEGLEGIAEDGVPDALAKSLAARTGVTVPLSPGVFAVHRDGEPIFTVGAPDRGLGLEAIAEDGMPAKLGASLGSMNLVAHGVFDTALGAPRPGPATPGQTFEVTFRASAGDRLSFATMFAESNDLFFAPPPEGLALFVANGQPRWGDVTESVRLWDAGTERNEQPGLGPNQAPRQPAPNTGPAEAGSVRAAESRTGVYVYPEASAIVRVTLRPAE
jgi:hypothetical protein